MVARRLGLLILPAVLLAGPPRYARVGDFEGQVEIQPGAPALWAAAERNAPISESARIRTGPASKIEIEFDEGSALRLGASTAAEISDYARLSTGQRVTLLSFDHGLAYVTGQPEGRDSLMLAVPGAQVTFTRRASVRLEIEEQWTRIAVLRGSVNFSSPAANLEIREGQSTRVEPANAARFFFYREVLPLESDKWNAERDKALAGAISAAHVVQRYGLADLDTAGEWILTEELGALWRPKVEDAWTPFSKGRWRWLDGLGYTWVSDENWGWLPYHYGRWTRLDNLGWVWAPSKSGIFKPGDVYWLRGKSFLGWGPLAPGEQWDPADPVNPMPRQFVSANTTFAALRPGAAVIDPSGFDGRPKDPLKGVEMLAAPASPEFLASRLEAVRPLVNAGRLRVVPEVEPLAIETAAARPPGSIPPNAAPAPVVIVNRPAPAPPAEPEVVGVPIPYAYPVAIVGARPHGGESHAVSQPALPTAAPLPARGDRGGRAPNSVKRYKNAAESALAGRVVQELEAKAFPKALAALDSWTQQFHTTDFVDDRLYFYMLAYNGSNQPAKVLESSAPLVLKPITLAFDDVMQQLSVVYLATTNFKLVGRPTRDQSSLAQLAARQMLGLIPACFAPERRPESMNDADWTKSRTDLETLARQTIARATR